MSFLKFLKQLCFLLNIHFQNLTSVERLQLIFFFTFCTIFYQLTNTLLLRLQAYICTLVHLHSSAGCIFYQQRSCIVETYQNCLFKGTMGVAKGSIRHQPEIYGRLNQLQCTPTLVMFSFELVTFYVCIHCVHKKDLGQKVQRDKPKDSLPEFLLSSFEHFIRRHQGTGMFCHFAGYLHASWAHLSLDMLTELKVLIISQQCVEEGMVHSHTHREPKCISSLLQRSLF